MSAIECTICGQQWPVSEEDPDSAVHEVVEHAAKAHGRDPRLAAEAMQLVEQPLAKFARGDQS